MLLRRTLLYCLIPSLAAVSFAESRQPLVEDFISIVEPDPYDAEIGLGLAAGSEVRINGFSPGELGTIDFNFSTGLTLPAGESWSIRYGLLYRSKSFEAEGRVPFLQGKGVHALALDFRATRELSDKTTLLAGVLPGSYGQKYEFSEDFATPGFVSLAHRVTTSWVIVAGVRYNPKSAEPVLPVGGLRWSPTANLRVQLLFPRSTIEYDLSERTMVYATANLQESVYRINDARLRNVDEKLDKIRGRLRERFPNADLPPILADDDYDFPTLVNTELQYRDLQAGLGFSWLLGESWRFELEGGISLERTLDFHNAGIDIDTTGSPYYFRGGFRGTF